tara:strand:+ start:2003 stop:2110 length:108 start_codon:yes stop_codon:yes gene_type:complete
MSLAMTIVIIVIPDTILTYRITEYRIAAVTDSEKT